jgi:predicted protein tyrosine phosphatase
MIQLLFVCSRNEWRSPTAEAMFRNSENYIARSAGTSPSARVKVTPGLIGWADRIFVMEKQHKVQLQRKYRDELASKELHVLRIADDFAFQDPALIELLTIKLSELGIEVLGRFSDEKQTPG